MEKWEDALSKSEIKNITFMKAPVPDDDKEFRIKMLDKCKENLCGSYGTNWGCPPGACIEPNDLYRKTSFVLIAKRTYYLDVNDTAQVDKSTEEMRNDCKTVMLNFRKEGIECTLYLDGPCNYCGVCSYPDPCRYPDMKMPSISSLGIDIGKYLKKINEEFSFSKDRMTLYAFFFIA